MNRILLIAGREIRQRGTSKVYLVSTLIVAVLLAMAVAAPTLLGGDDDGDPSELAIGVVGEPAEHRMAALRATFGPGVTIETLDDVAALDAAIEDGDVRVGIAGDQVRGGSGNVFLGGDGFTDEFASVLGRADALAAAGLEGEELQAGLAPQPLEVVTIGREDDRDTGARGLVAYIAIMFLYGTFIMYGQWMTNGVIEEKSSRVVEVLLAAVRPRQLLAGKLLGLGVLGFLQLVAFMAPAATVGVLLGSDLIPSGVGGLLAVVAMWWVLGYAFYSTVMGSMGATASRPEDAQAVGAPATMLLIAAFFVSFMALNDPTGTPAVIASFVPFTAPMVMVIRIAIGEVAALEVVAAVALTVVAIWLMTVIGGRIYEGGLLRTGSRVKLREAWQRAA